MEAEGLFGKCFYKKFLRTILNIFKNKIIFENWIRKNGFQKKKKTYIWLSLLK